MDQLEKRKARFARGYGSFNEDGTGRTCGEPNATV